MGHPTPQHKQNSCTVVIRSSFQHSEGTKYKHFVIFLRWGMYELGYPLSDHYISIARALRLQTWYSKAPPIYIITTKSYSTCRTIFTQFHEVSNSTKILSIDYLCQELNWLITLMCGEKTNGSSFFLSPGICCKQFFPGRINILGSKQKGSNSFSAFFHVFGHNPIDLWKYLSHRTETKAIFG